MKHNITDEAVSRWAECIRVGLPTNAIFPGKMSDCEFTDEQRVVIRKVRLEKRAKIKASKQAEESPKKEKKRAPPSVAPTESKSKPLTKLRKMLYLQSGRCFFCGEILAEIEANIEHLQPLSRGGIRSEDNEVVCHKTLNETFGQMDLKRKFEFILRATNGIQCPKS